MKAQIDVILEKAIKKAIKNGWQQPQGRTLDKVIINIYWNPGPKKHEPGLLQSYESLIFNHDFAKALWPVRDEPLSFYAATNTFGVKQRCTRWQYHLQQMVIAENPIRYLGENI